MYLNLDEYPDAMQQEYLEHEHLRYSPYPYVEYVPNGFIRRWRVVLAGAYEGVHATKQNRDGVHLASTTCRGPLRMSPSLAREDIEAVQDALDALTANSAPPPRRKLADQWEAIGLLIRNHSSDAGAPMDHEWVAAIVREHLDLAPLSAVKFWKAVTPLYPFYDLHYYGYHSDPLPDLNDILLQTHFWKLAPKGLDRVVDMQYALDKAMLERMKEDHGKQSS